MASISPTAHPISPSTSLEPSSASLPEPSEETLTPPSLSEKVRIAPPCRRGRRPRSPSSSVYRISGYGTNMPPHIRLLRADESAEERWRKKVQPDGTILIKKTNPRTFTAAQYETVFDHLLTRLASLSPHSPQGPFMVPSTECELHALVRSVKEALISSHVSLERQITLPVQVQDRFPYPTSVKRAFHWTKMMGGRAILFRKVEEAERAFRLAHDRRRRRTGTSSSSHPSEVSMPRVTDPCSTITDVAQGEDPCPLPTQPAGTSSRFAEGERV
jgi:hypothetical protein